jgi:hypothetical protein
LTERKQNVLRPLGTILHPEKLTIVREAYIAAIPRLGLDDSEFRNIPPQQPDMKLAHLVIRLFANGSDDPWRRQRAGALQPQSGAGVTHVVESGDGSGDARWVSNASFI